MSPALEPVTSSRAQGHTAPTQTQQSGKKKQRTATGFAATGIQAVLDEFELADATSGTIMKLELINFMNHAHLTVDLWPGVNFVFGKNGSGKSALLAGCMVGLGCKAFSVKSGTKLSSYVQSGKQQAIVRVWLFNGGGDQYQPDVYGPQVLIERIIDANPKIPGKHVAKTCDGATVLTRSADIEAICAHFNIQVSNPCVVLTQEKARRFLASTDDSHRYEYFMQASGLADVKTNLLEMDSRIDQMSDQIDKFNEDEPALQAEVDQKKLEWEEADALIRIELDIADRARRLAFRLHLDAAARATDARAHADSHTGTLENAAAKLDAAKAALTDANKLMNEAQARNADVTAQVTRFTAQISKQANDKAVAEKARKGNGAKAERSEAQALKLRQEAAVLRQEAKAQQESLAARQQEAERAREVKRAALAVKAAAATAKLAELDAEADALEREMSGSVARKDDAKRAQVLAEKNVQQLEQQQRQLSATSGDAQRLLLFGPDQPRLAEALRKAAGSFERPPVGPIGMYVNIKQERWAHAIEAAIGPPMLSSYVVNSHADRIAFERVCQACRFGGSWSPQVVVMTFSNSPYALGADKLPERDRFALMIDAVEFTHPMVQQAVIDRQGIERLILADSFEDANAALWVAQPPRNVARAYLVDGYSIYKRGQVEGQDKPPPGSERRKTGVDMRAQLARLAADLAAEKDKVAELKSAANALATTSSGFKAREQALQNAQRAARGALTDAKNQVENLAGEGSLEEQELTIKLSTADEKDETANKLLATADELRDAVRASEREIAPIAERIKELQAECDAVLERSTADNEAYHAAVTARNRAKKVHDKNEAELGELERNRGSLAAEASRLEREAEALAERARRGMTAGEAAPDVTSETSGARTGATPRPCRRTPPPRRGELAALVRAPRAPFAARAHRAQRVSAPVRLAAPPRLAASPRSRRRPQEPAQALRGRARDRARQAGQVAAR